MAEPPATTINTASLNDGSRSKARRRLFPALAFLLVLGALGAWVLVPWQRRNTAAPESANYHWQKAVRALAADDFVLAKMHLAQCLEVWPINAEAHFLMARASRRADDDTGWQVSARKAELLGWDSGALELERRLMRAQSGDLRQVEDMLLGYLDSQHPEERLIFEALAKGYLKSDRLSDALALTERWSARYPEQWQPWLFRARALQLDRALEQALAEYRRVLDVNPDLPDAHVELAGILTLDSQFQEALAHFEFYLQRHPNDQAALVGLANCQSSLGQLEAARATLDRLFAEHKDSAAGFFIRAKVELAQNKPEEALRWLKRAEALAPRETDITYNLVLTLQRLGREAEAKDYERRLHDLRRQFDQLESVKKKIRRQPDNVNLRDEAGALALGLGRNDEAGHWLRTALQLDPNHLKTHQLLAQYFQKLGNENLAAYHRGKSEGK